MTIPIVIATHPNVTYIRDMKELEGRKVAVVDGYAVNEWIPRDFPGIRLVRVKTVEEGLKALQRSEVFAYIDNLLIIGHYQARMKVTNIKIAGETPYVNAQCMAVRKDWAILAGIVQKALDSISDGERNDINRKWLPIRYEHGVDYSLLWKALGIFALILLGLVAWNQKLAREIRSRKKAEYALRSSEQRFRQLFDVAAVPLSFFTRDGALKDINGSFKNAFGYTLNEVPTINEWWALAYPDPIYRKWVITTWEAAVQRAMEEKTVIEPIEYNVTCRNGDVRTVIISGTAIGDHILATFFDITERKRSEEHLTRSLAEKETLLRELYHRTNNTMQIIRSMMVLQAASCNNPDITSFVQEIEEKILTMALVHQKLYQSQDLSQIRLDEYLSELSDMLLKNFHVPGGKVAFIHESHPVSVLIDTAIPCGLIVHELMSNALKYAFPGERAGEIRLKTDRTPEGIIELSLSDNGIGPPEGFDFRAQRTIGLQTVFALAEQQLKGEILFSQAHGVSCTIRFGDNLYTLRV